jgi:hypothetical protein
MEVSGRIKVIGETQTFGASGFRKRELVVETFDQYPQSIMIEFVQDNVNVLDQYEIGQEVRVFINLRGREWVNPEGVTKYFNSIQGWRIEFYQATTAPGQQPAAPSNTPTPTSSTTTTVGGEKASEDDLPF